MERDCDAPIVHQKSAEITDVGPQIASSEPVPPPPAEASAAGPAWGGTGEVFQLGATGPWFSRQGAQNTYELDVRIVGPDELEKAFRDPDDGVDAGSGGSPQR